MDAETRRAEFAATVARSRVMLDPDACKAVIAEETATAVQHRTDGFSCDWAVTMPTKVEPPPLPPRTYTDSEIAKMFAEGDAATGEVIGEMCKQLRADIGSKIEQLEAAINGLTLRLDAMAHAASKREIIEAAAEQREHDHGAVVQPLERRRA